MQAFRNVLNDIPTPYDCSVAMSDFLGNNAINLVGRSPGPGPT